MPTPVCTTCHASALRLPTALVAALSACAAMSVAGVYYAQPLLAALAREFGIPTVAVGSLIAATHAGCATALLLLVPLGDRIDPRRLALVQMLLMSAVMLAVAGVSSGTALAAGMVGLGLLGTASTQGLIAQAAALAPASDRGRVLGLVQAWVMVGVLAARWLAGVVADLAGWRWIYIGAAAGLLVGCVAFLQVTRRHATGSAPAPDGRPPGSLLGLLRHDRPLRRRGSLGLLVFASYGAFWGTAALALAAPPWELRPGHVGALGLVGLAGAFGAAWAGRRADRGLGSGTTHAGLALSLVAWGLLAWMPVSLVALGLGLLLLEVGGQAIHATQVALMLRDRPGLHARLVSGYMLFYALGLGLGATAATQVQARLQWAGVCGLGGSLIAAAGVLGWVMSRTETGGPPAGA